MFILLREDTIVLSVIQNIRDIAETNCSLFPSFLVHVGPVLVDQRFLTYSCSVECSFQLGSTDAEPRLAGLAQTSGGSGGGTGGGGGVARSVDSSERTLPAGALHRSLQTRQLLSVKGGCPLSGSLGAVISSAADRRSRTAERRLLELFCQGAAFDGPGPMYSIHITSGSGEAA